MPAAGTIVRRTPTKLNASKLYMIDGRVLVRDIGFSPEAMGVFAGGEVLEAGRWVHRATGLVVIASLDVTPRWGPLRHVSVSYRHRDPSWNEIKQVRALFYENDRDVMMMLPCEEDYVALHAFCYHLWQTPEPWGLR